MRSPMEALASREAAPIQRVPVQHFYVDFIEGTSVTSACGARTTSTAIGHDPAAPRCVVCLDLAEAHP